VGGEDDGLFGMNIDDELQRCILVVLFHIPVFSVSFFVCVFVLLALFLCTFFTVCIYYISFFLFSSELYSL
jgi:hypothetical protein